MMGTLWIPAGAFAPEQLHRGGWSGILGTLASLASTCAGTLYRAIFCEIEVW